MTWRTPLSADQAEMVDLIRNSGVMLDRLVSDILDVSKIEAGQLDLELRPFDLDEALKPALSVMRGLAEDSKRRALLPLQNRLRVRARRQFDADIQYMRDVTDEEKLGK